MKPQIEQWRVFLAIDLPPDTRRRLMEHIDRLRESVPEARASWSHGENLHLTLKFLGDIPMTNVETLSNAAQRAAHRIDPFEFALEGCGAFPAHGPPRVLWIGIEDPSGKLSQLHQALEDECAKASFEREQRAFHPHLTIARIRKPQGSRRLSTLHQESGFNQEIVSVPEIAVIRSELRSEGSKHTVLSHHRFSY